MLIPPLPSPFSQKCQLNANTNIQKTIFPKDKKLFSPSSLQIQKLSEEIQEIKNEKIKIEFI